MAFFYDLLQDSSNITSSRTGVDYNDDADHKDDGAMSLLLVFQPQQFIRPPSNTISIFSADYKAKAGCFRDVAMSATVCQYVRTILSEVQTTSTSYHNFNTQHSIPSVTHSMNVTSDAGYSLYRGGEEVGGCLYMSVHNATFCPL